MLFRGSGTTEKSTNREETAARARAMRQAVEPRPVQRQVPPLVGDRLTVKKPGSHAGERGQSPGTVSRPGPAAPEVLPFARGMAGAGAQHHPGRAAWFLMAITGQAPRSANTQSTPNFRADFQVSGKSVVCRHADVNSIAYGYALLNVLGSYVRIARRRRCQAKEMSKGATLVSEPL
jgi:hypothetical protein